MNLYDSLIQEVQTYKADAYWVDYPRTCPWPRVEKEALILKYDMAAELGGGGAHAVSGMAFTTNEDLVPVSGIYLDTDQKPAWKGDQIPENPAMYYGRFVVIRLKKEVEAMEAQELYGLFRKLDYLRYHLFLKGVSARISSLAHREVLRISKEAVKEELTFSAMGKTWLEAYEELDLVEAVEILYFVKQKEDSLYKKLESLAASCEDITESLNVIFKGVSMDCNSCGQKAVCDAVEGLRQMHEEVIEKGL